MSEIERVELKACPFCGTAMRRHYVFWEHDNSHPTCIAEDLIVRDEAKAITAWNTRIQSISEEVVERAWREGWALCKASVSDDEAFCLTDDVEADAWADSETRRQIEAIGPLSDGGEVERLRAHIAEQITFVETRIQDGIELGATVWRIALEDVARENREALRSTPDEEVS